MSNTKLHHRFKLSSKNDHHNDDEQQFLLNQQENNESNDEKYNDKAFDKIPWKGITLAFLLTIIGSLIIVVFICSQMGWIEFKPDDNFTFLTLAFITLVPGLYHCMIAFRAFRGYEGYSFDDIADLN